MRRTVARKANNPLPFLAFHALPLAAPVPVTLSVAGVSCGHRPFARAPYNYTSLQRPPMDSTLAAYTRCRKAGGSKAPSCSSPAATRFASTYCPAPPCLTSSSRRP